MRILTATLVGSAGAMLAGVAVLANGAAIPLAAGVALAAGLGSGALMERIGHAVEQKQISEYNRRGVAGTLMLMMRVTDQAHADEVTRIMRENGATETKPITRPEEALVTGISAAAWTG